MSALIYGKSSKELRVANQTALEQMGASAADAADSVATPRYQPSARRAHRWCCAFQASSDPFLGWVGDVRGVDYYVRQFRDMKGSADLDALTAQQFENYGAICARLLARAHSQSPGWAAILGYLGNSDSFDKAVASWSKSYADQAERDFEVLEGAVKSGRIPCETGV